MTKYGLPVMGSSLIMMALDGLGRFFPSIITTACKCRFVRCCIKISGLIACLLVVPFGGAWGGLLFQIAKKPNAKIIYSKLFSYVLVAVDSYALSALRFVPATSSGVCYQGLRRQPPPHSLVCCWSRLRLFCNILLRWESTLDPPPSGFFPIFTWDWS